MVAVSGYEGNPFISLPGANNRPMGSGKFDIKINERGEFTGVIIGSGRDAKTYTVAEWNKIMTSQPVGYETRYGPAIPSYKEPQYGPQQ